MTQRISCEEIRKRVTAYRLSSNWKYDFPSIDSLPNEFTIDECREYVTYRVPKVSDDGMCSVSSELFLFDAFASVYSYPPLSEISNLNSKQQSITKRLCLLKKIVQDLAIKYNIEWIGIYRVVTNDSVPCLVKEAYVGSNSRAFFPLTKEFAAHSNNSTVAMSNTAIYIPNTRSLEDDEPYYTCDTKVLSEFCLPIFDKDSRVIGIIDAEAWRTNAFSDDVIDSLLEVAVKLGEEGFFFNLIEG
jgi:L-methionine (R)-S-oxide reductase